MSPETTAALIGALVGGAIGFLGTLARDWFAERTERKRLAAALMAELFENRSRFSDFTEKVLNLPEGQTLEELHTCWAGQKFFPVYENSTGRIGLFGPEEMATVVHTVGQFKNLIEKMNSIHDREERYSDLINNAATFGHVVDQLVAKRKELQIEDARELRLGLGELMRLTDEAIGLLQKYVK